MHKLAPILSTSVDCGALYTTLCIEYIKDKECVGELGEFIWGHKLPIAMGRELARSGSALYFVGLSANSP